MAKKDLHLPGDQRPQEPLLLLLRAEVVEDLGVAGVRRLAAEDELRVERAADLLVQAGVVEESLAGAACLGRHVRRPQPLLARARLQRGDQLLRGVVLALDRSLVRIDVLLHERAVARARLDVRGGKEHGQ